MPFSLADGHLKVTALLTEPANIDNITLAELTAGVDIQDFVLKSDFRLSPVASDTVPDTPLSAEGNSTVFGASNYEGTVTVFRDLDESGRPLADGEEVWNIFKAKGTHVTLVLREGPDSDVAWASGDEYEAYKVVTDTPQHPTDRAGYVKRTVALGVNDAALYKTVGAA